MPVDQTAGRSPLATRRPVATLGVLLVSAVVSAVTWVVYGRHLSDLGAGFAEVAVMAQVLAVVYFVLAGVVLLGGALVAWRARAGRVLLLVVLILSAPIQALTLLVVIGDCVEVLDGGVRVVGDRSVALAAVQLTATVATALATGAAVVALFRRR